MTRRAGTPVLRLALVLILATAAIAGCGSGSRSTDSSARNIIPLPRSVEPQSGPGFEVTPATRIQVSPGNEQALGVATMLSTLIGRTVAPEPPVVETSTGAGADGSIRLTLDKVAGAGPEGYELAVDQHRIVISANTPAGLFYGAQSLRQLLPPFLEWSGIPTGKAGPVTAPAVQITDHPRYEWRGVMLDVARHFLPVQDVKRFIDYMALYKLNRLHLHLTDDQGWRIEIKSWPKLATYGGSTSVGGDPGGYYTQEQYKDIVAYAAQRFISVVPEIDVPSHINAALASYPDLNCDGKAPPLYTGIEVGFSMICPTKETTFTFLDDVVGELAAMTPTPWIHIGGDEAKSMTADQYTQFMERMQSIVARHRKTVIGWDEISNTKMAPGAIVEHWRPENAPTVAVDKGAKVILAPADTIYLDQKYTAETPIGLSWAGIVSVPDSYSWDPLTKFKGLPEESVLGVEGTIFSETVVTLRDFEYLVFPRLPGVAEIAWSGADGRSWDEYKNRLAAQAPRWSSMGINYYRAPEVPWPSAGR